MIGYSSFRFSNAKNQKVILSCNKIVKHVNDELYTAEQNICDNTLDHQVQGSIYYMTIVNILLPSAVYLRVQFLFFHRVSST